MKHHKIVLPPEDVYPIDDWKIVQKGFLSEYLAQDETIFAIGNGYLGMRGNLDEGKPKSQRGTFINGFYESWPIHYGEKAFGFAEKGQSMVNVPDAKIIKIYVDDEPLSLPVATLKKYERTLDMKEGALIRELEWETPTGKHVVIRSKRLVSMEYRHLALVEYEVEVLNASANIILSSKLIHHDDLHDQNSEDEDPRKAGVFENSVFAIESHKNIEARIIYGYQTKNSGMTLSCGIDHTIETDNEYTKKVTEDSYEGKVLYTVYAEKGQKVKLTKFISYHTSRSADPNDLSNRVERTLDQAVVMGFEKVMDSQREYMSRFWEASDLKIKDKHQRTQQVIRFNLFHICQAAARAEGTGIGARGLTGSAYDGHYFWDSEIYVLPFLIYTEPRIARNLLRFRYTLLDKARERARQVNQKGALYPWRTINGEEASAFFAAGTAQYHINADIIYAMKKYIDATGDEEFLFEYGIEMLIETARMWYDLGCYVHSGEGEFHIHGVTGPDEYTAIVNNNLYTNMMARENLNLAVKTIYQMQERCSERLSTILRETNLQPDEVENWRMAAENMYIPYNDKLQIHQQDDNFLDREVWDFKNTPAEKYPLLLHYHPLVLYRHQVIKQADVVLASFLLGNQFTEEQKKRDFDYYNPLTTGDSSLSACIQGIMASEIGYHDLAREYFNYTVLMDFANVSGNVDDGAHIAAMGGTWLSVMYGFAGMRDYDGQISFNPHLAKEMEELQFSLNIRNNVLNVTITQEQTVYKLGKGDSLTIMHKGSEVSLKKGTTETREN